MPTPALALTPSVLFDTNPDGSHKLTRNGYLRFSLVFKDAAANPVVVIRGFRVAAPYHRIQLPISQWRDSVFSCIELSRDFEAEILALIRAQLSPTTTS